MKAIAIVPAYQAERSVGQVVRDLLSDVGGFEKVIVVDDGSTDDTAARAVEAGAQLVRHSENLGKGAALRTGLEAARAEAARCAVSVDADGQHPARAARQIAELDVPAPTLVLGTRDLARAGAPRANRISNGISNFFLSKFSGRDFSDTQCGLRRYPVAESLSLGTKDTGYAFESEFLLRAVRAGWPIVDVAIDVIYPPEQSRQSHFHVVHDPARIIRRVVLTLYEIHG